MDFNNAHVIVEKNNVGISLIQQLQKIGISITEFTTDRMKKTDGIRFLHQEMKHKRLRIPKQTTEIKALKDELRCFGVRKKRGIEVMEALTGHDDLVDALWIVNKFAKSIIKGPSVVILQD